MKKPATSRETPGVPAVNRFLLTGMMSALLACVPHATQGATIYWDGTGTDWGALTSWSTDANLITPDPGSLPGSGDIAAFSISSILSVPQTVNLNANRSVQGLQFFGFNISPTTLLGGGTNRVLTLGAGGITVMAGSGAVTVGSTTAGQNVALSLTATQSFQNDSTSALAVLNGVSLVSGTGTLTLTGSSTNAGNIISGVISNGGGTLAMTKDGAGTWTLSGANTFTGGFTLNAGRLNINNAAALGAAAGAFVINGGSIDNTTNAAITTNSYPLTINGDFTFVGGRGTTHDLNLGAGAATLGTAAGPSRTITTNEGTLTVAGIIANGTTANSITKAGAGALTLSAANTFTGGVTLSAGTLNINNGKAVGTGTLVINGGFIDNTTGTALTLTQNNAITIGGNFSFNGGSGTTHDLNLGTGTVDLGGSVRTINTDAGILTFGGTIGGAGGITKTGPGTLTLAGPSNTFAGVTTVNAGTLRLDYSTNDNTKLADGAALTLGGGTVDLVGGSHSEVVASTALTAGTTSTISRASGTAALQLNTITPGAGAFLKLTASGAATTDNLNNAGGTLGGWATITVGGVTSWAVNSTNLADGPITALAANADVNRLGGSIANTAANNVRIIEAGASGNITLAGGALTQINSLNVVSTGGAATIDPTNNTDVFSIGDNTGGGILHPSTGGGLTIGTVAGDGILTTGGTADAVAATLYITNEHATNLVTINSNVQNNGTDVVGISKSGVGTLLLAGTNTYTGPTFVSQGTLRAGSATAFGTNSAVTLASVPSTALDLNNNSVSIGSLAGGGGTGGNVSLGTGTLTTGGNNTATTFAGVITGTGGVTKAGTGIWTLTGGNSYTGATTITGGRIEIGAAAATEVLSDRTAVTISNATQFNLGGKKETIGSLAGGTLTTAIVGLGAGGALTTGGNNGTTSFGGVISGTGSSSVTKVGTGTWTLTNVNTFAGTLNINGGTVQLNNANTIANTTAIRLNRPGATLAVANASGETIGGVSSVAGSTINLQSAGNLTVTNTAAASFGLNTSTVASNRLVTVDSTEALSEGMLVNGTGINAGSRIAQILSRTTFLLDQNASSTGTNVINYTTSDLVAGNVTGVGGFTKIGAGELRVTGTFTQTGPLTVNNGPDATSSTIPESMLLIGSTLKPGNVLSDTATLAVGGGVATQLSIDFVQNDTNLAGFERIGGLSGGSSLTTINLLNRASATILAIGGNNASTTWGGAIAGDNAGTWVLKEGTGKLTLTGANTNDGIWHVDNGILATGASATTQVIDDLSLIWLNNRNGAAFEVNNSNKTEIVASLIGGGHGGARTFAINGAPVGFLSGNYVTGTGGGVTLNADLVLTNDTAANTYIYGGDITGSGSLDKSNRSTLELRGTNTYTGTTIVRAANADNTLGVLRLGVFGAASGLGPVGTGGQGSLWSGGDVMLVSGSTNRNVLFDLNGASQTVNSLTSTGDGTATVNLRNGQLTVNTTSGPSGSFNGNIAGNGNVNVIKTGGSQWTLQGINTFTGSLNLTGTGTTVLLNTVSGGTIADTASINVGTGALLKVGKSDVVGSISGGGTFDIDTFVTGETFRIANGASGAIAASGLTGKLTSSSLTSSGTFQLSGGGLRMGGDNTSYLGDFVIGSDAFGSVRGIASLVLDYSGGATDIVPAGPLGTGGVVFGGATVFLKGNSTADSTPKVTLAPGASQIVEYPLDTSRLDLGSLVHTTGGTIHIGAGAASTTNGNVNGIIGGYATFGAAGNTVFHATTWAVSNGAGSAVTGLAAYTASTAGVNFGSAVNYDATISDSETGAVNTLRFNTASPVSLSLTGVSTITSGGILVTPFVGSNTSQISGVGSLGTGAGDIMVHQYNTLGSLVIGVPITDAGGAAGLTKAGPGTLVLTGTNGFTGLVTVGAGRLQVGNGGSTGNLGTGGLAIVNQGVLAVNRSDGFAIGNPIDGVGWVRQEGAGTLRLTSSTSSYSGRTSVGAGLTLEVSSSAVTAAGLLSGLGSSAGFTSIESGGTLLLGDGSNTSVDLAETIILKGATLRDNTLAGADSTLSGAIGLLGLTNTLQTTSANDSMRLQGLILGSPDTSSAPGRQPANVVVSGTGTTTFENASNTYFGTTTINGGASLQIGTNSGGALGRGDITDNGRLVTNLNDGHYVLTNTITGTGSFEQNRNTVYLTGDNSYSGGTLVTPRAGENLNVELRVGMDTYTGSLGSGPITLTGGTFNGGAGDANLRYHLNQDYTLANTINLNPNSDAQAVPDGKNVTFVRTGLGSMTLAGAINIGSTISGPGTQRAIIQTDGGARLNFNATLNGGAGNVMNIVNNGIVVFGGTASNTFDGILSGNNTWVFKNAGTTTLTGVNTFNTGNTYIDKGIVVMNNASGTAMQDDNDIHVLQGATLRAANTETIGQLYMQRGATMNILAGANLTVDDGSAQLIAGAITGAGNLTLSGTLTTTGLLGNYMAMYGTNTLTGDVTIFNNAGIQSPNLTNALGSAASILLGNGGNIEYVGAGETFNKDISLVFSGNRITANGTGALTLAGKITAASSGTLQLTGQTGGYYNPITNKITGTIDEGPYFLGLAMPAVNNDDRFGVTGRWALTNKNNYFSGDITVNVGILEFGGVLNDGGPGLGGLGNGSGTTSSMGDLVTFTRFIDLGTASFDGRRYDAFGGGDQIGAVAVGTPTNALTPTGSVGTILFNDPNSGAATLGSNIRFTQSWSSTTNPGAGQIINDGAKVIVINGALTSGASGDRNWILDGSNTGANTINGVISNGSGNVVGILKEGAGTWRLNQAANTFTGTVTVANGTLQVAGGGAIGDSALVAISGAGADGVFSGTAMFQVTASETIGTLTGNINTFAFIENGVTLTIAGGSSTMNGSIIGLGGLTRTVSGSAAGTLTATARNSYSGPTTIGAVGTATASAGMTVYHLADGGLLSGIGSSPSAASNLVFVSNTAANQGGTLTWQGFSSQSTDRLFTMGLGTLAARIDASGTVIGTTAPTVAFSNTGAIAMAGSGTRTLTLGGTAISNNTFRPQITDGGGATTLIKTAAGLWLLNPGAAGNTYTGGTTISGGTLAIQAGNALGTNTVTINGGAGVGLELRNGITLGNAITNVTADGGIRASSGTNVLSGTVTATNQIRLVVDAGASIELNNGTTSLTGAGPLLKFGEGNLILSGVNNATGATTVRGGVLVLDYLTNNTTKLADGAALTLGGSGGLTTVGVDDNVAGQTYVLGTTGGTVRLKDGSHTEVVSATTLSQGANAVTRVSGTSVLRMNTVTRNAGATIDFGAASIAQTDNNNTNGILGIGYATVAKTDWATSVTSGAADTPVTAFSAYSTDSYGATNNVNVTTFAGVGTAANTLRFNTAAGGTLNLGAATFAMTGGGLLVTPNVTTGPVIITNGTIRNAATTAGLEALIIQQHSTAQALQIDAIIANNTNAQALTKSGAGLVILNAQNTQTGSLNLNEGELQVGGTAAAPTTATSARLGGANVAVNMSGKTTLRFLSSDSAVQDLSTVQGGGTFVLAAGNAMPVLLDTDNSNYFGEIEVRGGVLQVGANDNALGSTRGITTIFNGGTVQINDNRNIGEFMYLTEGAALTTLPAAAATLSGPQFLQNTTAAGATFNIPAPTTAGTVGLNISGIVNGANGFTKTGDGILQISANNFTDVIDGFTSANKSPSLAGQIKVNQGVLYVGNARALSATGAGNETVVAAGATLDLRGQSLNYGDDSDPAREIIKITGTGVNGTGALRNTTGTGQLSGLVLDANATVSGGGFVNGSRLDLSTYDTNINNASTVPGNFTRNQPTLAGNGRNLVVLGSTTNANFVMHETSITSPLSSITVKEGVMRIEQDVGPNTTWSGMTAANVTNGITIAYGGQSLADQTNAALGNGPNVGARLNLFRNSDIHHTVNIAMDGVTAAANGGYNYIDIGTDTIVAPRTYLDGTITLSGTADRNFFQTEAGGNFSVVEQGNLTVGLRSKLIVGGQITGAGGFTKTGFSELRLTNNNDFTGGLNVLRFGTSSSPWQSNTVQINGKDYQTFGDGEGWAEWGLTLSGTNGKVSGTSAITLQRRGMITLDNTSRLNLSSGGAVGGNNNDRINNAASLNLSDGWLRINGGTDDNTEALATAGGAKMNVQSGTTILDLYPTDGQNKNMTLTVGEITRAQGGVLRIQDLDATSTFSTSAAPTTDSVRVALTSIGTLSQVGGGGASGSTNRNLVVGVLGGVIPLGLDTDFRILGFNNSASNAASVPTTNLTDLYNQQRNLQFLAGSHFMTYDGGYLRPLDDSEYFTPANGVLSTANGGGQNVNLNDAATIMYGDTTINALRFGALADNNGSGGTVQAGTTLTSLIDHHGVNLYVDGTLSITSGMISSAYFTIGNSSSLSTIILGGNLDFGAREAIINNQNGMYRLTDGLIATGNLEVRSNILGSGGLTKTGLAQVVLDGQNAYSGLTTINDGTLFLRNGRTALGVGGAGNGVYISGNGNLNSGNGIQVGTAAAHEDILVGPLAGDQQVMRVDNDLTNWFSNLTIDNIDVAGLPLGTPRIRTDNQATSLINGNIGGGLTPISGDVLAVDSRVVQFESAGNNTFIIRGQIGDKIDGSGNAVPISFPISTLPTLAGIRTNENEVLRVTFAGGTDETNFILDRQYNAAGRLTLARGTTTINYDPAGGGLDGTGFWTTAALSKIPNADSTTVSFAVNGGTTQEGFVMGTTGNTYNGLFLGRAGQNFNMASWSTVGTGTKVIGGLNTSGVSTFGDGTGSLTIAGTAVNLYAPGGGTVVFNQRMTGSPGTTPNNIGIVKIGRGTVELQNTGLNSAGDSNFEIAGGTLVLNHNGQNVARVGAGNSAFSGGVLDVQANTTGATVANFSTTNAANVLTQFRAGANEIIAEARSGQSMTVNIGNANANSSVANLTRAAGATANFVEWSNTTGTPVITMDYNATTAATMAKNSLISWATYGTAPRTAIDFAMVDGAASNRVKVFARQVVEEQNDVTLWSTIAGATGGPANVSESGSSGFRGTLVTETVNSVHFDAPADSRIDISGTLNVVSGGIMVASGTGYANKTISGGNITAGAGSNGEIIIHHYGLGNLAIDSDISGPSSLTITGPSTVDPVNFNSTGVVTLVGTNVYTGKTTINGGVLSIATEASIGAVPTTAVADQLTINGGTLRFTGNNESMTQNRGVTIGGSGAVFEITKPDANLFLENSISSTGAFRGDLIKAGPGTLTIEGDSGNNPNFQGLIDVREGTLRIAGEDSTLTNATTTKTILGTSLSAADGTIFRNGTNFVIQMGHGSENTINTVEWLVDEFFTFEGNNRVTSGLVGLQYLRLTDLTLQTDNKTVNLNGPIAVNGTVTFDTLGNQIMRLNNGSGYLTGSGDIVKEGTGRLEFRANIPDWKGALVINQGDVYALNQADVLGTGNLTGKTITIGSTEEAGTARLLLQNPDTVQNWAVEINHDISVTYNPAQTKTLGMETVGNGNKISYNGSITLNDNLNIYMNDAAEVGGSQNYVNFNGQFKDGALTSGNITFFGDDGSGGANDNTSGRTVNYAVLNANNSLWTGDVHISANTTYDQDQTTVVRLGHMQALNPVNDVTMNFNSMLQVAGQDASIGGLITNGGNGPFYGQTNTMYASTNGSTEIIENAALTPGTLTINQTTPVSAEVAWDAKFRDGTLNSVFFAPGTNTNQPSAALNLVKAGNGWAVLTLDNDYTGTTTVTAGVLQVGRNGVGDTGAINAAGLTVNSGATLAGTGIVQGNAVLNAGAFLKPGDAAGGAIGTLTFAGNATITGTTTTLQAARASYNNTGWVGYTAGAPYASWISNIPSDLYSSTLSDPVLSDQHDVVSVLGTLSWASGTTKLVVTNSGYNPVVGDIFDFFDWFAVSGAINVGAALRTGAETGTDLDLFELGGDYRWDTSLFNSQGILVVVLPGIVPEPGRMMLLVLGASALLFRRRRTS
ncbi:MAG: autotransporter-associated beta strand repeat-containing protein [Verrucomicrobiaceae bacterium]|nr:autotransporter-associated beta strand repeat-containing protein [Verrucomicrobiaceae bacterium]